MCSVPTMKLSPAGDGAFAGVACAVAVAVCAACSRGGPLSLDRKSTRLNSSHVSISYAVFCLKKKSYLFVGDEKIILKLLQSADYNLDRPQLGIVAIDDVDNVSHESVILAVACNLSMEDHQHA